MQGIEEESLLVTGESLDVLPAVVRVTVSRFSSCSCSMPVVSGTCQTSRPGQAGIREGSGQDVVAMPSFDCYGILFW